MNWIWRYLSGYLTIEIDAENGEKILNKAQREHIHIWNLRCTKGKITGSISIKNFFKLRFLKRGINSKIKILGKHGFVFKTIKYKNRSGFLVGIILYTVILSVLSNFVWIINVEGNDKIATADIIKACNEIKITEGILKSKINNKYDAQRLQLMQDGIAWCSLTVEGSVLTVNLSESAVSDKEERKSPSNLKASFDGKIKKIDISTGNSVIKVGDTVARGDLLVSGVVQNASSTVFVHSEGEIIADTTRIFSAEGRFKQTVLQPTNKEIKRYSINFLNLKIPLYIGNIKEKYNYNYKINNTKIFGKKVPIKTATEYYEILEEKNLNFDKATLEDLLYEDIKQQIEKFKFINITEKSREVIETEEGILLKIEYLCEENIAVQDDILLNTEN